MIVWFLHVVFVAFCDLSEIVSVCKFVLVVQPYCCLNSWCRKIPLVIVLHLCISFSYTSNFQTVFHMFIFVENTVLYSETLYQQLSCYQWLQFQEGGITSSQNSTLPLLNTFCMIGRHGWIEVYSWVLVSSTYFYKWESAKILESILSSFTSTDKQFKD